MPPIAKRPKKISESKIDRARESLEALLECGDFDNWFSIADRGKLIEAKNLLRVGLQEGVFDS